MKDEREAGTAFSLVCCCVLWLLCGRLRRDVLLDAVGRLTDERFLDFSDIPRGIYLTWLDCVWPSSPLSKSEIEI